MRFLHSLLISGHIIERRSNSVTSLETGSKSSSNGILNSHQSQWMASRKRVPPNSQMLIPDCRSVVRSAPNDGGEIVGRARLLITPRQTENPLGLPDITHKMRSTYPFPTLTPIRPLSSFLSLSDVNYRLSGVLSSVPWCHPFTPFFVSVLPVVYSGLIGVVR